MLMIDTRLVLAALSLLVAGCEGPNGPAGQQGEAGAPGPAGAQGAYCSGKRDGLALRPLGLNARSLAARLEGNRSGGSQVIDIAPSFFSRFPLGSRSAMSTGCRWMSVTIGAER